MKTLNETFNVNNTNTETGLQDLVRVKHDLNILNNVVDDYEKTRFNLYMLLSQGQDALFSALEVAKQSEHPRSFEVVGNLIKQLADINHQLLDLSEKQQRIMKQNNEQKTVTNNNAIFIGSTKELNTILQNIAKD